MKTELLMNASVLPGLEETFASGLWESSDNKTF